MARRGDSYVIRNQECWLDIPAHESAVIKANDERSVAGVKVKWPTIPSIILLKPAELHLEMTNYKGSYTLLRLPKGIRLRFPDGDVVLESADHNTSTPHTMEITWYSDLVPESNEAPIDIEYSTPSGSSSKVWLNHGESVEVRGAGYITFPQ